jgi:hypothetical protein
LLAAGARSGDERSEENEKELDIGDFLFEIFYSRFSICYFRPAAEEME